MRSRFEMYEKDKLSRRDWFRLRLPRKDEMLGHDRSNSDGEVLQPIAHPPNHDGLDLTALPPMREATLTRSDLESLFNDIAKLASEISLMQRSSRSVRASASRVESSNQLEIAKSALVCGQTKRIQIRYRWQDALWIDTLEQLPVGFRLVRIAHYQT